jgi:putative copper resistance protein D
MAEALVITRLLHFAALMAAFGIAAFRLYAFAGDRDSGHSTARSEFDERLRQATLLSAVVALLTAVAMVPCIAASMTGSAAAAGDPAVLRVVLLDTTFGHVWCTHGLLAILLVALSALPQRHEFAGATATVALLTLVGLAWIGHAAMDSGETGLAHKINQMAHLAAAGLWLGGLAPLALLLRLGLTAQGVPFVPLARLALPHFSQMGYAAVALVALTGTVNSVLLVGSFEALLGTPYGRLLLVKIALFGAMVTLALSNRFRLLPRLGDAAANPASTLRALLRSVAIEQMLGLTILAVVAVLGTWPPAIAAGAR